MFTTNDPRKLLSYLKKISTIKIYVECDVISICSLRMLTSFLKKEVIKHEIVFIDDQNIRLDTNKNIQDLNKSKQDLNKSRSDLNKSRSDINKSRSDISNSILDDLEGDYIYLTSKDTLNKEDENNKRIIFSSVKCTCNINRLDLIFNMFRLLKQTNSLDESSLWALIVVYNYYKIYPYQTIKEEDSEEENEINNEICPECNDMYNTICIEIRNIEYHDKDGIHTEKDVNLPLLKYSNLYQSLKHDIFFISNNKLIYKKRKDLEDLKIKSFLAKKGVSLLKSNERYSNLDHTSRKYIYRKLDLSTQFIRKKGHTYKMSSLDCFLLMSYYCLLSKGLRSYLLLDNFKDNISTSTISSIYEIVYNIKDSIANVSKVDDILIYKLKCKKINNLVFYIKFAQSFIEIYRKRRYPEYNYIILIDKYEENSVLVFGRNIKIISEVKNSTIILKGMKIIDRLTFFKSKFTDINK
ncbi:cell division control protein 45 (CDC45) [Vairimorpha necatrix]|uniref:Cell division control protein 45 (CDC45) n=1 Tax=Vairimorpha necatrix TaxID=6039 RepID=A0AAX4JIS7_9MICR